MKAVVDKDMEEYVNGLKMGNRLNAKDVESEIPYGDFGRDVVQTVKLQREKLQNSIYDLLILDLNMPERLMDDNDENAGVALVDELIGVISYKKPTEIVVLSAYDECEDNFVKEKYRNAFIMLRYDELSEVWSTKLKAIVEYRLLYSLQMQEHETIDVAIISTVSVETEAVKRMCTSWSKESFPDDINTYYVGTLLESEKSKKVVTVQSTDMGMVAAAITTVNLSKHYRPRYIIIVGLAAGIGEHEFGDILIPREVWNYSSGKYCEEYDEKIICRASSGSTSLPSGPMIFWGFFPFLPAGSKAMRA